MSARADFFKFEIGNQRSFYNHFTYEVEVTRDHCVFTRVFRIGTEGERYPKNMFVECQLQESVEGDPQAALRWAHETARQWIDKYVSAHIKIQHAVEDASEEYGENH